MKLSIAKPEDAGEIIRLHDLAGVSQAGEEVVELIEDQLFIKAMIEDQLVGTVNAGLDQETCHIHGLVVHPDFAGKGVGTVLLEEIEKNFPLTGRYEMETPPEEGPELAMGLRNGYEVFRRTESRIYMEKLKTS